MYSRRFLTQFLGPNLPQQDYGNVEAGKTTVKMVVFPSIDLRAHYLCRELVHGPVEPDVNQDNQPIIG